MDQGSGGKTDEERKEEEKEGVMIPIIIIYI